MFSDKTQQIQKEHKNRVRSAASIGHQQDAVGRLGDGGIVVALVQQAPLIGGGLGGQRRPEKQALALQQAPEAA